MKRLMMLGIVVLALGARWWEPLRPPCPEPAVCRDLPCFMGQRCDGDKGCLPRILGERSFSDDTRSLCLDVTGQGGVALAGSYDRPADDGEGPAVPQTLVARLAPDGEMKWSASFGPAGHPDGAEHIRVEADGSLWVAGTFRGDEITHQALRGAGRGGADVYVMKLMGGGRALWLETFGTAGEDRVLDLEVGSDGNGYLILTEESTEGFTLQRLGPDGRNPWTRHFPGTAPTLAVYQEDQIYLTAAFTAPKIKVDWQSLTLDEGNDTGAWLGRLDWDGDLVWARTLPGGGDGPRSVQDVAALADGDIVLSGFGPFHGFPVETGTGRMFAARLSPAGIPEHIVRFGPRASGEDAVHVSLTPGSRDRLHVTGSFDGAFLWNGLRPRPDLEAGIFTGTLEADGSFGSVLVLRRSGPAAPVRAARDDGGRLHLITRGDNEGGFKLLAIEP